MIPIGAIVGGVSALTNIIQGSQQGKQADQLRGQYPRQKMSIPKGVTEAENIYRNNAYGTRLPGQGAIENNLLSSFAGGARAIQETAQDPASKLAAISGLYGQQMGAQTDLGINAAQNYYGNQLNYANFLGGTKAAAEREVFDYNKIKPYEEAAAAASALEEASLRNKKSGMDGLMGSLGGLAGLGIDNTIDKNVFSTMYMKNNPNASPQDATDAFRMTKRFGAPSGVSGRSGGYDRSIYNSIFGKRAGATASTSPYDYTQFGQDAGLNYNFNWGG